MSRIQKFAAMPLVVALAACGGGGGGGGTSATLGGFVSFSEVQPNSTHTLGAMTREAGYEYDTQALVLTGLSELTPSTDSSTLTLGFDGNRELNRLSINTPYSSASFSASGGDQFVDVAQGIVGALSADETRIVLAADPYALGWDYQSFGVWLTGYDTGSGRVGVLSAGAVTPASAVPTSGSATYLGAVAGLYVDGTGLDHVALADLQITADFGSRSLDFRTANTTVGVISDGYAYSNAALDLSGSLNYAAGSSTFSGEISSGGGMTGKADGRFYGPRAEEVGGVFAVTGAGQSAYAGAFGARR